MSEPIATLKVDDQHYGGWTSVRIGRSIESISGLFELTVTERWPEHPSRRAVRAGDACAVSLGEETVITGYVDEVNIDYDAAQHSVTVRGRDRTADLVDCSAETVAFQQQSLGQMADHLVRPFGIPLEITTDIGAAFRSFGTQESETVFEFLERAARHRGVLLLSDGLGGLKIARPSKQRLPVALALGANILSARGQFSLRDRYRTYIVKGSQQGSDTVSGEAASEPTARVEDKEAREGRQLVILAEDQADIQTCGDRAKWERNVRLGRGTTIAYTAQGWTHSPLRQAQGSGQAPGGTHLWPVNRLLRVRDPWMGINMDLLIASVAYVLDERGTVTELTLVRPEAFDLVAIPEPTAEESWLTP